MQARASTLFLPSSKFVSKYKLHVGVQKEQANKGNFKSVTNDYTRS